MNSVQIKNVMRKSWYSLGDNKSQYMAGKEAAEALVGHALTPDDKIRRLARSVNQNMNWLRGIEAGLGVWK